MIRVLLVEDDHRVMEVLEWMFASARTVKVVGTARSYHSALRFIKSHPIDLATIDVHLGSYNGMDLCRLLRRTQPQVYIAVCSSDSTLENRQIAGSLGVQSFLAKPVDKEDVLELISDYTRWRERHLFLSAGHLKP